MSYHGIEIHVETSSSVDDWPVHHRSLELEGIDVHAIDSWRIQLLRRLLSIQVELLLQRVQSVTQRQGHIDT
jgi:hypothetical protein